jgi:hypothetical protein
MLSEDAFYKTKYPTILDLKNKEAEFDKVMAQYISVYKSHLNGMSGDNLKWTDYDNTISADTLNSFATVPPGGSSNNVKMLGKSNSLQVCKSLVKDGKFSSIVFMEGLKADNKFNNTCYGLLEETKVKPNEIGTMKGFYTSVAVDGEKSATNGSNKMVIDELVVLNNKLHVIIGEIRDLVGKIYSVGMDDDIESVNKLTELKEQGDVLDNERNKLKSEQAIVESLKAKNRAGKLDIRMNEYMLAGFTLLAVGIGAFTFKTIMKERRSI